MPYVTQDVRDKVDSNINGVVEDLNALKGDGRLNPGYLNYVLTTICLGVADRRYHSIAEITGVLENVKQEFYRRFAAPYEQEMIEVNGDLRGYSRYDQ